MIADGPEVREVSAGATHELRRLVLRAGNPDADVVFDGDAEPGSFHLGVVDGNGAVVAVASAHPAPTARRPGALAWRLRGMAVDPTQQGAGLGTALLDAMVSRVRELGAEVMWAAGRDHALGFYRRRGWAVVGEGYQAGGGLPHHTVVIDLARAASTASVGGYGSAAEAGAIPGRTDPAGHQEA